MQNEIPVTFKIKDTVVKEKIAKIRKNNNNFTKLFITWILEYKIKEAK